MLHLPHSPVAVNSLKPIPAKRPSALALLQQAHILVSFPIVSIVPEILKTTVSQSREILTFSNRKSRYQFHNNHIFELWIILVKTMGLQSIDIKQERIRNQWPSQDEPNSLIIKDLQGTKDSEKGETLAGVSPNLLLRRIVLKPS